MNCRHFTHFGIVYKNKDKLSNVVGTLTIEIILLFTMKHCMLHDYVIKIIVNQETRSRAKYTRSTKHSTSHSFLCIYTRASELQVSKMIGSQ